MANISILSRLIAGTQRNVDLSINTLVVDAVKFGGGAGTDLTKIILDKLVNLQNGTDFANGTNAHTHDGRYFTETELSSATASSGSDLIGDDNTYTNFTPTAATVKGALAGINTALGAAASSVFSDSAFRVQDNIDATKQIALEASGITTATTRTITMPDANVDLGLIATAIQRNGSIAFTANQPMGGFKLTGLAAGTTAGDSVRYEQAILISGVNAFAANQSFGGFKATNAGDPTLAQDLATKAYVDSLANGQKWKANARVATTASIANLSNASVTIDGVTLIAGDRVLVKDGASTDGIVAVSAAHNGIYVVGTVTTGTAPFTRALDADSAAELQSATLWVAEGTANADKEYTQTADTITLGTTLLVFVISSANHFSGHDMISLSGGQISVDLATVSGLESSSAGSAAGQLRIKLEATNPSLKFSGTNELGVKFDAAGALLSGAAGVAVQVDNSSIEISTNSIRVKAAGITEAHLAASVAGAGLTGGAGTALAVNTDASSLEVVADQVRVKAAGIQASHLNTNVADQSTITGGAGAALAVQHAPFVRSARTAGEAFAANTSFAVRFALTGETAGTAYKADKDASVTDKFYVVGIAHSTTAVIAAGSIPVVTDGSYTLGSLDTAFAAGDIGKPVFLTAAGAFSITAPTAINEAVVRIGIVEATNKIFIQPQVIGVN